MDPTVIYETVRGSRAQGLAHEGSDTDLLGIVVGPAAWYHGYLGGPDHLSLGPDHVRYEIRRFFDLAAAASPTLVDVLWTGRDHHRIVTAAGRRLLDHRDAFLSQRLRHSFANYGRGQLDRLRSHRRWLHDPPAEGDDDRPHYETWLAERNLDRTARERAHGYDTRHGVHLVRLLRMANEILATGRVVVDRPDAAEMIAIRGGAWPWDRLVGHAEALLADLATAESVLPEQVDRAFLDRLCVEIVEQVLSA